MAREDLSKRGKVGDVYRSGSYKKAAKRGYKTTNVPTEKFKKVTTLKGQKLTAAQRAKVGELKDIGTTHWEKGKGVVGPGGKAFTGTVQLASGKTASYFQGRRVGLKGSTSSKPRGGTSNRSGSGSTGKTATNRLTQNISSYRPMTRSSGPGVKSGSSSGSSSRSMVAKGGPRGSLRKKPNQTTPKTRSSNPLRWDPSDWANWFQSGNNRPQRTGGPWSGRSR